MSKITRSAVLLAVVTGLAAVPGERLVGQFVSELASRVVPVAFAITLLLMWRDQRRFRNAQQQQFAMNAAHHPWVFSSPAKNTSPHEIEPGAEYGLYDLVTGRHLRQIRGRELRLLLEDLDRYHFGRNDFVLLPVTPDILKEAGPVSPETDQLLRELTKQGEVEFRWY